MFKYNLAVFIKSLLLFAFFSSIIYAQEVTENQNIQSSQIYERIMFIEEEDLKELSPIQLNLI